MGLHMKTWRIKTTFINPYGERKEVEIEKTTSNIDSELIGIKVMLKNNNCRFLGFEYQVV